MHQDSNAEIVPQPVGQLSRMDRAEIDMQISTAHAYPRSITKFVKNATEMATLNIETASKCFYTLKRTDKDGGITKIEGPSVRMAEIVACCWGNMRAEARIVDQDDHFIYAQGTCHDLENNLAVRMEVSRRITGRNGRTYSDDMIGVTGNAASSIAFRNAVMRVVPRAMWLEIYEKARSVARGDMKTLATRRDAMLQAFKEMRVTEKQICEYIEVPGVADIGLDELMDLVGIYNAIKNGDTTAEQAFRPKAAASDEGPKRKTETETETVLTPAASATTAPDPAAAAKPAQPATSEPRQTVLVEPGKAEAKPEPKAEEKKATGKFITEKQVQDLQKLALDGGWYLSDLKKHVKAHYGSDDGSLSKVKAEDYGKLRAEIEGGTSKK